MNGGCGVQIGCNVQKSPNLFKTLVAMKFKLWEGHETSADKKELLFIWKESIITAKTGLFNQLTEFYNDSHNNILKM